MFLYINDCSLGETPSSFNTSVFTPSFRCLQKKKNTGKELLISTWALYLTNFYPRHSGNFFFFKKLSLLFFPTGFLLKNFNNFFHYLEKFIVYQSDLYIHSTEKLKSVEHMEPLFSGNLSGWVTELHSQSGKVKQGIQISYFLKRKHWKSVTDPFLREVSNSSKYLPRQVIFVIFSLKLHVWLTGKMYWPSEFLIESARSCRNLPYPWN